jgi:hypothetical protein
VDGKGFRWVFTLRLKEVVNKESLKSEEHIHKILYEMLWYGFIESFRSEELWIQLLKRKSDMLFILDGFDEVSESDHVAVKALMKIRDHHEDIHVLITSRPHVLISPNTDLVLENVGFIKEDIPKYINVFFTWYEQYKQQIAMQSTASTTGIAVNGQEYATSLREWLSFRPKIFDLCYTPINLELLCSLWLDEKNHLSDAELTISDLYQKMLIKLLRRYLQKVMPSQELKNEIDDINKDDRSHAILSHKKCEKVLKFVEQLAAEGYKTGTLIYGPTFFKKFLTYQEDDMQYLREVGLLKCVGELKKSIGDREYYFMHKSFQEFLAARYYARHIVQDRTSLTREHELFFQENKFDPYYHLVWTYVAGIIRMDDSKACVDERKVHRHLAKYFHMLLAHPRDLYGVGEIEVLMTCGEEVKWPDMPVTEELLQYIGSWVMGIAWLHENHDQEPLLRNLSKLFRLCPGAMSKMKYRGQEHLFNVITYESIPPRWMLSIESISLWLLKLNSDEGFWFTVFVNPLRYLTSPCEMICHDCNFDCACIEDSVQFLVQRSGCSAIWGYVFLSGRGMALFCTIVIAIPIGLIYLTPFVIFCIFVLVVPVFYSICYGLPKYRAHQASSAKLLSAFKFDDILVIQKLMNMVRSANTEASIRLLRAFSIDNFEPIGYTLVKDTLYFKLNHPHWKVKLFAFKEWRRFCAKSSKCNEALFVFNSAMYSACFSKQDDLDDFTGVLSDVFAEEVLAISRRIIYSFDEARRRQQRFTIRYDQARSWIDYINTDVSKQSQLHSALQNHFCLSMLTILHNIGVGNRLYDDLRLLTMWQLNCMIEDGDVKTCYRQELTKIQPNYDAHRNFVGDVPTVVYAVNRKADDAEPKKANGSEAIDVFAGEFDYPYNDPIPQRLWQCRNVNDVTTVMNSFNINNLETYYLREVKHSSFIEEMKKVFAVPERLADAFSKLLTSSNNGNRDNEINAMKEEIFQAFKKSIVEFYLRQAFYSSCIRDIYLVIWPRIVMFAAILLPPYFAYGYASKIFSGIAIGLVILELISTYFLSYAPLTFVDLNKIEEKFVVCCRMSRSFTGVIGMILLVVMMIFIGFPTSSPTSEKDLFNAFHYHLFAYIGWIKHVEIIAKIETELFKEEYFLSVLELYPGYMQGKLLNSNDAFPNILRRHLAPHHRAIWQQRDGSFCWYRARTLKKFRCAHSIKLKADIKSIRLLSKKFKLSMFSSWSYACSRYWNSLRCFAACYRSDQASRNTDAGDRVGRSLLQSLDYIRVDVLLKSNITHDVQMANLLKSPRYEPPIALESTV